MARAVIPPAERLRWEERSHIDRDGAGEISEIIGVCAYDGPSQVSQVKHKVELYKGMQTYRTFVTAHRVHTQM